MAANPNYLLPDAITATSAIIPVPHEVPTAVMGQSEHGSAYPNLVIDSNDSAVLFDVAWVRDKTNARTSAQPRPAGQATVGPFLAGSAYTVYVRACAADANHDVSPWTEVQWTLSEEPIASWLDLKVEPRYAEDDIVGEWTPVSQATIYRVIAGDIDDQSEITTTCTAAMLGDYNNNGDFDMFFAARPGRSYYVRVSAGLVGPDGEIVELGSDLSAMGVAVVPGKFMTDEHIDMSAVNTIKVDSVNKGPKTATKLAVPAGNTCLLLINTGENYYDPADLVSFFSENLETCTVCVLASGNIDAINGYSSVFSGDYKVTYQKK